jgi:hypothetical protein
LRNFVLQPVFNSKETKETMKKDALHSKLREASWRRKLTDTERAELRAHPEMQADLEMESRLSEALARLPDAPVPSNFTARVLQAVEREEARPRATGWHWTWRVLVPRLAFATAAVVVVGLAVHHYELNARRNALATSVALLTEAQPLPSVEALKNFEAIQRMSQPHADEELLALLK